MLYSWFTGAGFGSETPVQLIRANISAVTFSVGVQLTAAAVSSASGIISLGNGIGTAVGPAGGADALPATPLGYIVANVHGTQVKIPYYFNTTNFLSSVSITGTAGQFSCGASPATLFVGMTLQISGVLSGTGTIFGYTNPKIYYVIATNGTTTFTLSATSGGSAITTTSGTPTGLTYTLGV